MRRPSSSLEWGLMRLSELAAGRDNNFNLIRLIAAGAVVLGHSFVLSSGTVRSDPLWRLVGMEIGTVAVDVFFVISGFLVTASLLGRDSLVDFFWGRALRIFPGLWLMLLLCVFVLGVGMSTLSAAQYLADPRTYRYLLKCATLLGGVEFRLPGLFESNPYHGAVNGSLWSMPYEIKMYLGLALIWAGASLLNRRWRQRWLAAAAVLAVIAAVLHALLDGGQGGVWRNHFVWLAGMFASGAAAYLLRARIVLSTRLLFGGLALLGLGALLGGRVFLLSYLLTLPYLILYLAHVPGGRVRKFNRLGDYSYGLYIYSFPVQQLLLALLPGLSAAQLFATSASLALMLAAASWHGCERPALAHKPAMGLLTRRLWSGC
ncbi:acyltransferase family protein [Roseateles violae]|uniref:Acyltransferase n=1 Tax=Roseateles violae TaxID=3058042 RepID=A0ABT8DTU1_9BURK|nr:acyltransferase [Pelomonas sp. PFR6]MDN3920473.1 acyltransferase [Pelomonas sp. PFR6]